MFSRFKAALLSANMQAIYGRLGGRSFLVVVFFAATGFVLSLKGKLTPDYAALATALSGFHIYRAVSEDNHDHRND